MSSQAGVTTHEKPRWYRSLYWRIGLGFVFTLAAMMAVQGAVVVWLLSRGTEASGPPPRGFARIVASDVGEALTADPALDLEAYLQREYQRRLYPFFVVMTDGRAVSSDGRRPDPAAVGAARTLLERRALLETLREASPRLRRRRLAAPGDAPVLGGGPLLRAVGPPGEILVDGRLAGVVVAVPPSFGGGLGPTLAGVAAVLLLLGTVLASRLIFTPVRRRLADLEATAAKLGGGQLSARARTDGGDEVALLAVAFNRMAADLDARAAEAAASERLRRQLLADVSHELMTPLTSMRGYLETLAMPAVSSDSDTRARYLAVVSDESRRLEQIVGDLLDLARIEGGGGALDVQDVAVEGLFGRTRDRHQREAAARGVSITTQIAPGAEIVQGDGRRLEQALQNLVANALRHTPEGGRIELACDVDGSDVVIAVRDSGSGIGPEHLPHVFDRFYKAESSRGGSVVGSGLGLSVVKAIVERHGGTVAVTSAAGQGARFTMRLPARL